MVTIGSLTWTAKVENAGRASAKANNVADSMQEADEKAQGLNRSLGETGGRLRGGARKAKGLGTRMTRLTGVVGLLTSAIFFLGSTLMTVIGYFGGLSGILAAISGAISAVIGYASAFVGWLAAGSAGALAFAAGIGAILGLLGVWILKITGVLDAVKNLGKWLGSILPGWVRDAIITIIGLFAGPLAAIGGFIIGFIEGGFDQGIKKAKEVIQTFIDAAQRLLKPLTDAITGAFDKAGEILSRLQEIVSKTWNAIVDIVMTVTEPLTGAARSAGESVRESNPGLADTIHTGFTQNPIYDAGDWVGDQLHTGGMVTGTGLAEVKKGEAVIPPNLVEAAKRGGGGGGGGVHIETLQVQIGDQSIDLRNMSRSDKEELARMIAEETGGEVEQIIGGQL